MILPFDNSRLSDPTVGMTTLCWLVEHFFNTLMDGGEFYEMVLLL